MTTDLTTITPEDYQTLTKAVDRTISAEHFFAVEPYGHTEYQLRNFLAPNKDCPTTESKYRQYCRELWSRVESFQTVKFGIMEAGVNARIARARQAVALTPLYRARAWWKARNELALALAAGHALEADKQNYREVMYGIELKHRIVRETKIILNVLEGFDQSAMEHDRMKSEAETWAKKAESIPELRAILQPAPPVKAQANGA